LADLTLSVVDFDQSFDADRVSYTATADFDVTSTTVTVTTASGTATLTVNGDPLASGATSPAFDLSVGLNVIVIVVTAEDGTTNRTYTITLRRQGDGNARLADLTLSGVRFDQIYQPGLADYTATVSLLTSTTTVIATPEDPLATVAVNRSEVVAGTESEKIDLNQGLNTITVVVTTEDGFTIATYTLIITRETTLQLTQGAYVKASNPDAFDQFGYTSALSGDTLAVGAASEDSSATGVNGGQSNNSRSISGAVYVFTRDGAGVWSQQAYIKASNRSYLFGEAIALDGDMLAVGAWLERGVSTGINGDQTDVIGAGATGAVYVFTRDDAGLWTQQAYIKASNAEPDDRFGWSVALNGNTLAVGAPGEESVATGVNGDQSNNGVRDFGAVYVFTRDGAGDWSQQAYIKASQVIGDHQFGSSVALSGDTLAVGVSISGAAYVFSRNETGDWSQQARLVASNPQTGRFATDGFGLTVALSGDTLAVGAFAESSSATGINGNQNDVSALGAGAVYVFTRSVFGIWTQQAYIKASNTQIADLFGFSVALSGDVLAVGARDEDSAATGVNGDQSNNSASESGAVYVFTRNVAGVWRQQAYIKASNTESGDEFGNSPVALSGDTLVVGAWLEDSASPGIDGDQSNNDASNSGAVYVFQ